MSYLVICSKLIGFAPQGRQFTLTPMVYPKEIKNVEIFVFIVRTLFKRLIRSYLTIQAFQSGG